MDSPTGAESRPAAILWTSDAATAVRRMRMREGRPEAPLRIDVMLGGCKGWKLAFRLDDEAEDDAVFRDGDVRFVVQRDAMPLIDGAVLDYEVSHRGSGFRLEVPAASTACACGTSFSALYPGEPVPVATEERGIFEAEDARLRLPGADEN